MPLNDKIIARLNELGVARIPTDMRTLHRSQLAEHLAAAHSGRIVMTRLMRSLIWQVYELIQGGEGHTIEGNLRTFWYQYAKPVLAHIHDDDHTKTDPYDVMLDAFRFLIGQHQLFRYADFDFTDENWEHRRIGTTQPHLLVFTEKTGWMRFLKRIHQEKGVSVLALGGAPSALTSEYTADHLLQILPPNTTVHLVGIVDFDPSGQAIANAFQHQLAQSGLTHTSLHTLIHPRHYTTEQLTISKVPLPPHHKTLNDKWVLQTQGVGGHFGLEAESMPPNTLRELLNTTLQQLTSTT